MILMVVFVVLMILWLFGGGWYVYNGPTPNPVAFGTGTLIPWVCVAILGYVIFRDVSSSVPEAPRHRVEIKERK